MRKVWDGAPMCSNGRCREDKQLRGGLRDIRWEKRLRKKKSDRVGERHAGRGFKATLSYFQLCSKGEWWCLSAGTIPRSKVETDHDPRAVSIPQHTHLRECEVMRPAFTYLSDACPCPVLFCPRIKAYLLWLPAACAVNEWRLMVDDDARSMQWACYSVDMNQMEAIHKKIKMPP